MAQMLTDERPADDSAAEADSGAPEPVGMLPDEPRAPAPEAPAMQVETRFPGGNAIIETISGDTVQLRPDSRNAETGWFYWSIRVRGAAGKTLNFVFSDQDPLGVYGPAVSVDEGLTWQWLNDQDNRADSFRCSFPQAAPSVRLSSCLNYTDLHWQRFCGSIAKHSTCVREDILCFSNQGRAVPRLHVGRLDGKARFRALLTARHHACETMANFVLEGLTLAILDDTPAGAWFRENVELVALPFMDRDGVEAGDPGKGRQPHDHNRDYGSNNLYPETRALREFARQWSDNRLSFMADLHSPWIRGQKHERIYQIAKLDPTLWAEQRYFGDMLANAIHGPLPFSNKDDAYFGDEWRVMDGRTSGVCAADWFAKLPGMRLSTSFEIPYANCDGVCVTADGVRAFGNDLATTIRQYLNATAEEEPPMPDDVPMAKIYTGPKEAAAPAIPDTASAAEPPTVPIAKIASPSPAISMAINQPAITAKLAEPDVPLPVKNTTARIIIRTRKPVAR